MRPKPDKPAEVQEQMACVPASRPLGMSLELYQAFLEDCPEPMQITDTSGVIRVVNRCYCEETGFSRQELVGHSVLEFGFYVDTQQRAQLFERLKAQGRVREFEVRLRTKRLGEFAALVSASLIVVAGETLVMSTVRNLSEMAAAQEALRKSEELLRSAFQASLDPITLSQTKGEFVEVNEAFCEQSGYSRAEVLGRTAKDIGLWMHISQREAFFEALAAQGSVRAFEADMIDRSGGARHCLLSARITIIGGVPMVLTVTKDITKLMEAEDALRKSEEFFRTMMHDGVDPVALAELNGTFVEVNDAFVALTGYSREEIIGKNATQLGLWTDMANRDELRDQVAAHGAAHNFALTARRKDGTLRHCLLSGRRMSIGGREMLYSSTKDITDQHQAAAALRASEQRFRFILNDVSQIAIQGYDENREVVFWNEASEHLYGYTEQEALGRKLEDLIIPDAMRQGVIEAVQNWITLGIHIPSGEMTLRHKDNGPVHVYSSHVLYTTGSGRKEMYCIDLNMSDIKRMQGELIEAKERAEAADKAKSEFLANMSHEIRTPLNGMLGMLQLMQMDSADKNQNSYADMAVSAGHRLLSLLTDVLDFSTMNAGQVRLRSEPFSLPRLLDSVAAIFHVPCKTKKLRMSFQVHPGVPETLLGDEARLRQILFNLVGNAVKFTSSGGVHVEAWARPSAKHGPGRVRLYFTVADTGIGIPDDKITHVFRRFTQSDGAFTREYEGAGLGLAIVKRIVALMQGGIAVESEVGVGTTMNLHVLLATAQPAAQAEHGAAGDAAAAGAARPLRLLLAEDDATSQLATRVLLRRMGHDVTIVETGRMAVEALQEGDFDGILMDIQMPEMDGVEATRLIRTLPALEHKAHIPIIALTAYAMNGDREKFLAAGMDGHVPKPVELAELQRALRQVAERRVRQG
ncbi:MAG: PAS domain S-box protein [Humidesulfovibrio sp.]